MAIIFLDNYRLSISAATATIVWASSLVNTVHAISRQQMSKYIGHKK